MIIVYVLVVFGLILMAGSLAAALWLAETACTMQMQTAPCTDTATELLLGLMFSWPGLPFWVAIALGAFISGCGYRVKTHHLARR